MTDASGVWAGRYEPFAAFADWGGDVDLSLVDRASADLARTRASASDAALDRAVQIATRYAAVDTGAIEGLYAVNRGFTRTIATQSAAWEHALRARGEHVARSIEDALAGYEFVLDAVTTRTPLTASWVRTLHEVLCRSQETYRVYTAIGPADSPLPKGQYKTMPNSPLNADTGRVHHYAPVEVTPAEMSRLIDELSSEAFLAAHPVRQAAYAHYAFVCIHPFADGNGRVARALASVYLYRQPGVPLVVFADQKDRYLDALEAADAGDARPFVRFIADRAVDAVELVRLHLTDEGTASASTATSPEVSDLDVARATDRLVALVAAGVRSAVQEVLPAEVSVRVDAQPFAVEVVLTLPARTTGVSSSYSAGRGGADELTLDGTSGRLTVRVSDLIPTQTTSAQLRVAAWAAREADSLARDLAREH